MSRMQINLESIEVDQIFETKLNVLPLWLMIQGEEWLLNIFIHYQYLVLTDTHKKDWER